MDGVLLSFLGREREECVRIGERMCVLRLLSARETLALRREIAQEDCRDEEERALRVNAALLRRSLRENENGAAVFSLHIDAAGEDAATRVVTLHVRADEPQENIKERLLGATLAWQTDAGETQLGEAACVRVYQPMVFGLTKDEWMGILWAGLLLVVTVSCLFAAFNSENKREKYCE